MYYLLVRGTSLLCYGQIHDALLVRIVRRFGGAFLENSIFCFFRFDTVLWVAVIGRYCFLVGRVAQSV
jgi:hypothetical protein